MTVLLPRRPCDRILSGVGQDPQLACSISSQDVTSGSCCHMWSPHAAPSLLEFCQAPSSCQMLEFYTSLHSKAARRTSYSLLLFTLTSIGCRGLVHKRCQVQGHCCMHRAGGPVCLPSSAAFGKAAGALLLYPSSLEGQWPLREFLSDIFGR